jgi:hypothetical protein
MFLNSCLVTGTLRRNELQFVLSFHLVKLGGDGSNLKDYSYCGDLIFVNSCLFQGLLLKKRKKKKKEKKKRKIISE